MNDNLRHQARLMRRATYASVSVACILMAVKFTAWLMTDSVSMLATFVDSMLDGAASLVTLLAVRHASQPADREHRFGHGKAEPLAGLMQSAFITGSAVFLFVEAGRRLYEPKPVEHGAVGLAVMALSIGLTIVLVAYQKYVVRRTESLAIAADRLHYTGDLIANVAVIAAILIAAQPRWQWVDSAIGACIAVYIVINAVEILRQSLDQLMDREFPDAERARIRELVLAHPEITAMHDLRTRRSGRHAFIQFHIEMDGGMTLEEAHQISDAVEAEVLAAFPEAEVLVHQDPAGVDEKRAIFA